jgi:hypothetical protein
MGKKHGELSHVGKKKFFLKLNPKHHKHKWQSVIKKKINIIKESLLDVLKQ